MLKVEPGMDKLVLRFADKPGYATGLTPEMEITIAGPDNYSGTWKIDNIDESSFEMWAYMVDTTQLPEIKDGDKIKIEGDSTAPQTITFVEEGKMPMVEGITQVFYDVAVLNFPSVNLNFSAAQSKIESSQLYMRFVNVDGKEKLECTIFNYEPVPGEFGYDVYEFYLSDRSYYINYPTEDIPIRFFMSRIE